MTIRADLHVHTTASDGRHSPAETVRMAAALSIDVLSVTDHDTVAGVSEALAAGRENGVRVLSGIELSCGGEEEIHLLGYGLDGDAPAMADFLASLIAERRARMAEMLRKAAALGIEIQMSDIEVPGNPFVGRVQLARMLVKKGRATDIRQAFVKYLVAGKPLYEPRQRISMAEGIKRLKAVGAVTSLAHPGRLSMGDDMLGMRLPGWIEAGLDGLEAYHESHDRRKRLYYDRLARRYGLLVTGGSDFHGGRGHGGMGEHIKHWPSAEEDVHALLERVLQTTHDKE